TNLDAQVDAALKATLALLRRSRLVRYAEVRFVSERSEYFSIRDYRPEQVTTGTSRGVGIRVLGRHAWGFACSADLSEQALERAAQQAIELAEASGKVAKRTVIFPSMAGTTGSYTTPLSLDPFSVSLEDKLGVLDAPVRA